MPPPLKPPPPPVHADASSQAAPYAWVIDHRPLDHCSPPACRLRARDVHGYVTKIQGDGDPGANVAQGIGLTADHFFQRGVSLRAGESFEFDVAESPYESELDVTIAGSSSERFTATITVASLPLVAAPAVLSTHVVDGKTAPFVKPLEGDLGRFERYGKHVRVKLPARDRRGLRITITNAGTKPLTVGSPLVMRKVEGRGPRQAVVVVHDALLFHEARAFLHDGTRDPRADWVSRAVADRGVYYANGVSPGQGTGHFAIRFFTGSYFAAQGWPGMFDQGFDETLPAVLPGPIARAAEQGFVTAFVGNNFTLLPDFGNVGWDLGYNSESKQHPAAMVRVATDLVTERPNDDLFLVWWNAETHAPHGPGRKGPPAPPPGVPKDEIHRSAVEGTWRNLLDAADRLEEVYDVMRKASPTAQRVMFIGADHSSSMTEKMRRRPFRTPWVIQTGLLHACGGSAEESMTPFALLFDDPERRFPRPGARATQAYTSSLAAWRAIESFFGVDLSLPKTSSFELPLFEDPHGARVWDDRVLVSIGATGTVRAMKGTTAYALFEGKLTHKPAWMLSRNEQRMLVGAPNRDRGMCDEELYDDAMDAFEYENMAGKELGTTIAMRREVTDWMAAHYEDHAHPRFRYRLVFPEAMELELFAPHPFTALVDDVPVPSADPRVARVRAKEVVVVEGAETAGIVEIRGAARPLTLRCSANGLPLDALTSERPRFDLVVARTNCPLPAGRRDPAGPNDVLFSFEPARGGAPFAPGAPGTPGVPNAGLGGPRRAGENDELLAGMKRWGYVRDIDEKKK